LVQSGASFLKENNMEEKMRFYQGTSYRSVVLNRDRQLTLGTADECDLRLPPDAMGEAAGVIRFDDGGWKVSLSGETYPLNHASFVSLCGERRIALEFLCDDRQREAVRLTDDGEWRIGRNDDADIVLPHPRVSGSHAKLYRLNGEWRLCDLNSTNGSFVNAAQVRDVVLREADEIAIGPYTLVFSCDTLRICGGEVRLVPRKRQDSGRPVSSAFSRSPRIIRAVPQGEMEIDASPGLGSKPEINWLTTLMPTLATLLISVAMMAITKSAGMLMSAPMMLIGVAVTAINYRAQTRKFEESEAELRRKYRAYLDEKEARLKEAARLQRDAACFYNPSPEQCLTMARHADSRLFERTTADKDFLSVRVGVGSEPLCVRVRAPQSGFVLREDALSSAAQNLAERYREVSDVPVLCDLLHAPTLGLVGERMLTVRLAQAILVQLSTLHGSDDVRLAVIYAEKEQEQWAWTRWLPHVWNENRTRRYVACGAYEAEELFGAVEGELKRRTAPGKDPWEQVTLSPHWVFIVADMSVLPARALPYLTRNAPGISMIVLGGMISALPAGVRQIIEGTGGSGVLIDRSNPAAKRTFAMDQISCADCDAFARALAPIRLETASVEGQLPRLITLLEGYHVEDPAAIEIDEFWDHACSFKSLSVPIGIGTGGVYYFDIHEKRGGPHGLVAGSNGSGKSEMAQSFIASMALQFSPRDVNFVLVDFKGTSLLAPLMDLPHLAGSISNLDQDVHRCLKALDYEIVRRQRLVADWNERDILGYQKRCRDNPEMEPMPFLILVIDEFADFKVQFPDFTTALEHIFRGGRSVGIYTLIMTQKPAGVVTEQMYANARFRWCLKVMSESDSREMLGVSSAALIDTPGRCYVKTDAGVVDAVQPFFSGAAYEPPAARQEEAPTVSRVTRSGARQSVCPGQEKSGSHGTQLEAVVRVLAEHCRVRGIEPARRLWLPPLGEHIDLGALLPAGRLWTAEADWQRLRMDLRAVIGMTDDPGHQEQRLLTHGFMEGGNLLVYGMPLSGKTTLLTTMAVSLCSTYAVDQVRLYLMEFGGYTLRTLECFPHVCGVGGDDEPEIQRRILGAFSDELRRRKQLFRRCGAGSFSAYREGASLPAWVLLVDNLNLCCRDFAELTDELVRLSREGEAFGLYLAAASTGISGLNYQLTQNFKTVLTLRLTDPSDYAMLVGRAEHGMPRGAIGRGLVRGPREFQTAIAFADSGDRERAAKLQTLAAKMREAWHGVLPPKIAPLPEVVPYGSVAGEALTLGLDIAQGQPACLPLRDTVGILVSAADERAGARVRGLLLRQLGEQEGLRLITNASGARSEAERLCGVLAELAPELRRRQSARRAGSEEAFEPVVILLDDLMALLESGPDELVARLEVFVRLGAGLDVTVIVLDLARNMETLYFGGDILMETLHDHPMLLAGGDAQSHPIVDCNALNRLTPGVLERGDWVLARGERLSGIRPMESGEEDE